MKGKFMFVLFILQIFMSCCASTELKAQEAKIVSWNIQTFFDANTTGTEYSEFIYSKNWNQTAYETRIDRLCEVIKSLNADIYLLEEIENNDVILDISNKIANYSWNQNKNWKYAFFAKNEGDSIGCAVISRFPIYNVSIHNLDIKTEKDSQPSMRPIIKTTIQINGKELSLFINHWKSKSGGAEESEIWRNWQEKMLSHLMEKDINDNKYVFSGGDFNRDISEFCKNNDYEANILLDEYLPVFSPWIYTDGEYVEPGSYYYNNNWERIDNFFTSSNISITDFQAKTGVWSTEEGIPNKYTVYNGEGFSDHLPIFCKINFK